MKHAAIRVSLLPRGAAPAANPHGLFLHEEMLQGQHLAGGIDVTISRGAAHHSDTMHENMHAD